MDFTLFNLRERYDKFLMSFGVSLFSIGVLILVLLREYTKKKITPYDSAESKTELSFSGIPEIRPEQRSCEQTLDDSPEWSDFCDIIASEKFI